MRKGFLIFILLLPTLLMAQSGNKVTENFLKSFADAFNAHDVNAIMSHMTDDCVFEASAGPDSNGEKFTGQGQVRKALKMYLQLTRTLIGVTRNIFFGRQGLF